MVAALLEGLGNHTGWAGFPADAAGNAKRKIKIGPVPVFFGDTGNDGAEIVRHRRYRADPSADPAFDAGVRGNGML